MIDRDHHQLSLVRQYALLDASRASVNYRPAPARAEELALMTLMDRQYPSASSREALKTPFYSPRKMKVWLMEHGRRSVLKLFLQLFHITFDEIGVIPQHFREGRQFATIDLGLLRP